MQVNTLDKDGLASLDQLIKNAIAAERERCAKIAEHLSGWGNKATQRSGLAEHIAKVIRNQEN